MSLWVVLVCGTELLNHQVYVGALTSGACKGIKHRPLLNIQQGYIIYPSMFQMIYLRLFLNSP